MSDLRGETSEVETGSTGKIAGAIVIAIAIAGAAGYAYQTGAFHTFTKGTEVVASREIPSPRSPPSLAPSVVPPRIPDQPAPQPTQPPIPSQPQ